MTKEVLRLYRFSRSGGYPVQNSRSSGHVDGLRLCKLLVELRLGLLLPSQQRSFDALIDGTSVEGHLSAFSSSSVLLVDKEPNVEMTASSLSQALGDQLQAGAPISARRDTKLKLRKPGGPRNLELKLSELAHRRQPNA